MDEQLIKYMVIGVALLALFIKIPKIELPIWKWILRGISEAMLSSIKAELSILDGKITEDQKQTAQVSEQVNLLQKSLKAHIEAQEEEVVARKRADILKFADQLGIDHKFSEETWHEILSCIDEYNIYCNSHPGYKNSRTASAQKRILSKYDEVSATHGYL